MQISEKWRTQQVMENEIMLLRAPAGATRNNLYSAMFRMNRGEPGVFIYGGLQTAADTGD